MKDYKEENLTLLHGNCLNCLKDLDDNSIDSIVTDPPYGLSFMGKKWDYEVPNVKIWEECFRVLKSGGHLLSFAGTRTQHRMAVNIEDAGFEIRDMIAWVYGCYSADTEVLTERGWLHYADLLESDNILQWDKDSNVLSWVHPQNIVEYDVDEDMVLFENRHTSQLLTKNHSVYGKIRKHSKNPKSEIYERIDAGDLRKNWQIDLPLAGTLKNGIAVEHPYLIGWWLTDAWLHGDGKACMFSQSKLETLEKLRTYLENHNIKFSEYVKESKNVNHKDEHTFYVTGEQASYLIDNYPKRELTWEVMLWDDNTRHLLLEGLLDGDGSRSKDRGYSEVFWSLKRERLDIVQAICLSLNIRSHIDYKKGCVYLNRAHNSSQLQAKHKKPLQPYKGKVWCLKTETGAFVVRRSGKAFISGNSGFPKSLNISKAIDKKAGAERKVVGKREHPTLKDKSRVDRQSSTQFHASNPIKDEWDITESATDEAKYWDGFGTALKPALEPITLARKPLEESTIVGNVLKYGTGGINIDDCRVETQENLKGGAYTVGNKRGDLSGDERIGDAKGMFQSGKVPDYEYTPPTGRFPANFIHDGSEEVEECFPHTKDCKRSKEHTTGSMSGTLNTMDREEVSYGDNGSASRFFYCAKASKSEKGKDNKHPTVKPVKLMEYLVTLVTPKGGTILDPFMGSGTTGVACKNLGVDFIGVEMDDDYFGYAKNRITSHTVETDSNIPTFKDVDGQEKPLVE